MKKSLYIITCIFTHVFYADTSITPTTNNNISTNITCNNEFNYDVQINDKDAAFIYEEGIMNKKGYFVYIIKDEKQNDFVGALYGGPKEISHAAHYATQESAIHDLSKKMLEEAL